MGAMGWSGLKAARVLAVLVPAVLAIPAGAAKPEGAALRVQFYRQDDGRRDEYRRDEDRRDGDRRDEYRRDEDRRDGYGQDRYGRRPDERQDRGGGGYGGGAGRGGSYQQSCGEARQDGSTLTAICGDGRGGRVQSSIDVNRCGRSDIGNNGGVLQCGNVRGAGRRVN